MFKTGNLTRTLLILLSLLALCKNPLDANMLYLLPEQNKEALSILLKSIDHSKKSIKITIYNFTHKKIAKRLKAAAKRGVHVEIIFDAKSNRQDKRRSMLYYLAKYRNIDIYQLKGRYIAQQKRYGIMHLKAALFDHRRVIFGSANWTYSAFGKNYEMLYVEDNYGRAKEFERYFKRLKKVAKPFG